MKLALFSEQVIDKNNLMNRDLIRLINKKEMKIAYIPSKSDTTRKYFNEIKSYYESLGARSLFYFDLDEEYNEDKIQELLTCDAIHLSGGDTEKFIELIRKRSFEKVLKSYVDLGKVLIGASAGSILMTLNTEVINFIGDESKLENKEALGFTNFHFIPHWGENKNNLFRVIDYSIREKEPIYCCKDGYGIIVNDDNLNFYGDITKVFKGNVSLLNGNVTLY